MISNNLASASVQLRSLTVLTTAGAVAVIVKTSESAGIAEAGMSLPFVRFGVSQPGG